MFSSFERLVKHPIKFRLFLLSKLPAAYFSGVRIKTLREERCEVTVPYSWFTTNPFRSTYFACLSMAAEMSTGALAMAHSYQLKPSVSMLIISNEGKYQKKATGKTTFLCEDGLLIKEAISKASTGNDASEITVTSTGRNTSGEVVAIFTFTWSFKIKSSKV